MTDTMFEVWLRKQWSNRTDPFLRPCNDVDARYTYQDQDTELAYVTWQAAQADARALVGELVGYIESVSGEGWPWGTVELRTKAQAFMEGK